MGEIIKADSALFNQNINKNKVLVDFYADWCSPCRMLAPVLEELASLEDITILKVNVDNETDLARQYGVSSIPTVLVFEKGKVTKKSIGYVQLEQLQDLIK